ncbi:hypothetical protein SMC26_35450 [Actinomadura fulvescens]
MASSTPAAVPTRPLIGRLGPEGNAGGLAVFISTTRTPVSWRCSAPYWASAVAAALAYAVARAGVGPDPVRRISGASGDVDTCRCSRAASIKAGGSGGDASASVPGSVARRA